MRDRTPLILFAAALALFAAAAMISIPEPGWRFQTVDAEAAGIFVDIAVDTTGTPHITYMDEGGGVTYASLFSTGIRAIDVPLQDLWSAWQRTVVDDHSTRGNFMSLAMVDGRPAIAYQDNAAGNSQVMYAERRGGGWSRETVDSITTGGANVGMYVELSKYRDNPFIFYHRGGDRMFSYAWPDEEGWSRTDIEQGIGWYTGAASCNRQVFAGYGGRASNTIWFGTYTGDWRSQQLDGSTNTRVGVAAKGCTPYMAYFDNDRGTVRFVDVTDDFTTTTIGSGRLSRVSLTASDRFHVAYDHFDRGLVYGVSGDGRSWNTTVLDTRGNGQTPSDELEYNGIAVDRSGTVHIAYTDGSRVIHAVRDETVDGTYRALRLTLGLLALILLLFALSGERRAEGKIYRRLHQNI